MIAWIGGAVRTSGFGQAQVVGMSASAEPRSAIEVAAVSKQLYASKHFDASLGMTLVLDRTRAGAAAVDIVYVNQSRLDVFAGFFGLLKRAMARPRVRAGMERALLAARDRLERAIAAGVCAPGAATRELDRIVPMRHLA